MKSATLTFKMSDNREGLEQTGCCVQVPPKSIFTSCKRIFVLVNHEKCQQNDSELYCKCGYGRTDTLILKCSQWTLKPRQSRDFIASVQAEVER